jgi:hypothetical protein
MALMKRMVVASLLLEVLLVGLGYAAKKTTTTPSAPAPTANVIYTGSSVAQTLTASAASPLAAQYFGMHIHHLADPTLKQSQLSPFPSFPVSTLRLWDSVGWSDIEPLRDRYNWTRMDAVISKAKKNGVGDFIFTFGYVPRWASSNPSDPCGGWAPGHCDAPANLVDLDEFANKLVQRYCGVVNYYESWNEPSLSEYWNGSNQELLAITKHIYAAVKNPANCGCSKNSCKPGGGANPNKVLLPSINSPASSGAMLWLQNWLSYAGNPYPYADIAAFHGYGYGADPEMIESGVGAMKSTLAGFGLGSAELWNTEASWGNGSLPTGDQQASWVIRYHIVQAFAGVARFTWYAYDNCQWGTLWNSPLCTQTSASSGATEASVAYATVQKWLTGATLGSCSEYADGTWLCELTRANGYAAFAAWNSNGDQVTLQSSSLPGLVQYRDWQNQTHAITDRVELGAMPVLLENASAF